MFGRSRLAAKHRQRLDRPLLRTSEQSTRKGTMLCGQVVGNALQLLLRLPLLALALANDRRAAALRALAKARPARRVHRGHWLGLATPERYLYELARTLRTIVDDRNPSAVGG